jgi:ribulose-5-phosphate 4-epimerase/fuculose-1-phosphate aldolase
MNKDTRQDIVQVAKELYRLGLLSSTGGNISSRCEDNPQEMWITPSAIFKGDLQANMLVRIDM